MLDAACRIVGCYHGLSGLCDIKVSGKIARAAKEGLEGFALVTPPPRAEPRYKIFKKSPS